jgi:DNA mismatch endonuclease, patch repair protein
MRLASMPKTRTDFWTAKFDGNVQRDARAIKALDAAGWKALVIWGVRDASSVEA